MTRDRLAGAAEKYGMIKTRFGARMIYTATLKDGRIFRTNGADLEQCRARIINQITPPRREKGRK